ncbi:pseudouridine synthase [Xylariomycetidae sp. FL0641]|nr:pseudouridine synthase [Xylariomycetidae sp. FL0641]
MDAETTAPEQRAPQTASDKPMPADNASGEPASIAPAASESDRRDGQNQQRNRRFDSNQRGRGRGKKRKTGDSKETDRPAMDRRQRNAEWQDRKRQKVNEGGEAESSYMSIQFPEAEIAAEERRPKRKAAVLIGYAGTGYHGLQINHKEKTIEGDLFAAIVKAGAISKANAEDPRKSSFVRCARTDKGVHAAGNMISLKMIIEDSGIVKKINDELPPQIRVWGIEKTNRQFSCYASCDSRWYEYLMPSYCLLPPHPDSFLGKKVLESVKAKGTEEEYATRLNEVKDFWAEVEKNDIQPILDGLDPKVREIVLKKIHAADLPPQEKNATNEDAMDTSADGATAENQAESSTAPEEPKPTEETPIPAATEGDGQTEEASTVEAKLASAPVEETTATNGAGTSEARPPKEMHPVDRALKDIKAAYVAAKRRYRVTPDRLSQLQQALDKYVGTKNYHNYTIQKSHGEASAKRHIKSFVANPEPIQINDTQWLSLKVHGQSFMMHQIRKMVGMAVLVTRCATPLTRVDESYTAARISIPKAPALGLLLERPVFDVYNQRAVDSLNLQPLDFAKYEKEIQQFKETQIYQRIFEQEERENSFHTFFNQIDNFKSNYFLWVTADGIEAANSRTGQAEAVPAELEAELGDEGEEVRQGEEEG